MIGNQEVQVFGRDDGRIDGIAGRAVVEHIDHLERHIFGDLLLRLEGTAAEMRRQDDLVVPAQRAVGGQRLLGKDIQRGPGDLTGLNGLDERGFVDDTAAGDVEHARRRFHLLQLRPVNQIGGLRGQRDMDGQKVALRQQRRQIDKPHAPLGGDTRR